MELMNHKEKDINIIKIKLNENSQENLEKEINSYIPRNYGIDLLKIIAMINIINLHINLFTPLLNMNPENKKYKQVFRLEAFSFWPVDAFGIISGIVNYKKYKFINIIYIWFEYFFYSVTLSLYFYYNSAINKKTLIYHFFPVAIRRNWYVNAYILMYLFLPFVVNSFHLIDKTLFNKIIFIFFFIHSVYHIIIKFNIPNTNFDYIDGGYSSLWLLILFILGSYIGKYLIKKQFLPKTFFIVIYLLSSFVSSEYIFYSYNKYKVPNRIFLEYFSPTIVIQALSLIFFFANLKITNKYFIKMISFLNPLNFNVTLIHSKAYQFKTPLIIKLCKYTQALTDHYLFFKIYGISILIYFICIVVDYFRFLIFKLLRIRALCNCIKKILF